MTASPKPSITSISLLKQSKFAVLVYTKSCHAEHNTDGFIIVPGTSVCLLAHVGLLLGLLTQAWHSNLEGKIRKNNCVSVFVSLLNFSWMPPHPFYLWTAHKWRINFCPTTPQPEVAVSLATGDHTGWLRVIGGTPAVRWLPPLCTAYDESALCGSVLIHTVCVCRFMIIIAVRSADTAQQEL